MSKYLSEKGLPVQTFLSGGTHLSALSLFLSLPSLSYYAAAESSFLALFEASLLDLSFLDFFSFFPFLSFLSFLCFFDFLDFFFVSSSEDERGDSAPLSLCFLLPSA